MQRVLLHLFCFSFLFLSCNLIAQNPHPFFRNYNIDEGLPSPEVHYSQEDAEGFMWFATDNGVSRFDGYGFTNFGLQDGLSDLVALYLQLDEKGRIWVGTLSGKLFYYENNFFHEFAGNPVILEFMKKSAILCEFYLEANQEIFLKIYPKGILKFDENGQHELITSKKKENSYFVYKTGIHEILGSSFNESASDNLTDNQFFNLEKELPIEIQDVDRTFYTTEKIDYFGFSHAHNWASTFADGHLYLTLFPYIHKIKNQKIISSRKIDYRHSLKSNLQNSDGSIYIGTHKNQGLRKYKDIDHWEQEIYDQFLPGKSINHLFEDSRGSIWIATLEHGVFECPDPKGKIYDRSAGLDMDYISAIAEGEKDELFVALRNGKAYQLNIATDEAKLLPPIGDDKIIFALAYDKKDQSLWATNAHINYYKNDQWYSINSTHDKRKIIYNLGKIIDFSPESQRLWSGSFGGFGCTNTQGKYQEYTSSEYDLIKRTFAIKETKNGKIWVGQSDGLFEFVNGKLIRPAPQISEFYARIDDIDELSNGTLVIATKGHGLLLWDGKQLQKYQESEGMNSNMLENIYVDEAENIWVGTLSGLNVLRKKSKSAFAVERYTTWHGLPSNQINQVLTIDQKVWIATAKGLVAWNVPEKKERVKAPTLSSIKVNGNAVPLDQRLSLGYKENNINYEFFTLSYDQFGKTPYRYRMNNGMWNYTLERNINFSVLPSDDYIFAVQSQNVDGIWSKTATHEFVINKPWYLSLWLYIFFTLLIVFATFFLYRFKANNLRKEFAYKSQVIDLEKKALQAQMKPHFIFNCLNSIQYLIIKNKTDEAMRYLSRFAQLVRGTLNASISGEVTLHDEILLLKNYLDLEKLRFKEVLNYSIEVDPQIDKFDISFPPMLLQPYVENAVVHGIEGKEKGGFISIQFVKNADQVLAIIKDNGSGFKKGIALKSIHESVGMTLTERRLELMHEGEEMSFVKMEEILSQDEKVIGTQVEVVIG